MQIATLRIPSVGIIFSGKSVSVGCVQERRGEEERLYRLILRQAVTLTRQARTLARLQGEIEIFQDLLYTRTVQVSGNFISDYLLKY